MIDVLQNYVAAVLVLIGALFALIASIGLLRLPDFYTRMHAASKAGTLGSCVMLMALAVHADDLAVTLRALGGVVFFLLTAPVSAHLLASLVFTEVYFYIFTVIRALLGVTPWSSLRLSQLLSPSIIGWQLWSWLIYWVIVGGLLAYRYYERYLNSELRLERLEHSYSEARLNALRMQLDPHFLFNALNTISSHVERDPKLTRRMIEHLGDLLRMSLESKDRQEGIGLANTRARLQRLYGDGQKLELVVDDGLVVIVRIPFSAP